MAKTTKNKPPAAKPTERHGPQLSIKHQPHGVDRLRRALSLSTDVPIGRLCEEAAIRIEQMPPEQMAEPDETGMGSPL